ncbi:hypothetical protein KIPB_010655, partial [Kipferlia bialata]
VQLFENRVDKLQLRMVHLECSDPSVLEGNTDHHTRTLPSWSLVGSETDEVSLNPDQEWLPPLKDKDCVTIRRITQVFSNDRDDAVLRHVYIPGSHREIHFDSQREPESVLTMRHVFDSKVVFEYNSRHRFDRLSSRTLLFKQGEEGEMEEFDVSQLDQEAALMYVETAVQLPFFTVFGPRTRTITSRRTGRTSTRELVDSIPVKIKGMVETFAPTSVVSDAVQQRRRDFLKAGAYIEREAALERDGLGGGGAYGDSLDSDVPEKALLKKNYNQLLRKALAEQDYAVYEAARARFPKIVSSAYDAMYDIGTGARSLLGTNDTLESRMKTAMPVAGSEPVQLKGDRVTMLRDLSTESSVEKARHYARMAYEYATIQYNFEQAELNVTEHRAPGRLISKQRQYDLKTGNCTAKGGDLISSESASHEFSALSAREKSLIAEQGRVMDTLLTLVISLECGSETKLPVTMAARKTRK